MGVEPPDDRGAVVVELAQASWLIFAPFGLHGLAYVLLDAPHHEVGCFWLCR
jgi:hypothetical protein